MSYTKIGVAGPVGSGKTALIEILIRKLAMIFTQRKMLNFCAKTVFCHEKEL